MSSDQHKIIDSLTNSLSESLGLKGSDGTGDGAGAGAGGCDLVNDQPLHDTVQSEVKSQPDHNNSTSTNMDARNFLSTVTDATAGPDHYTVLQPASSSIPLHEVEELASLKQLDQEYSMDHPRRGTCLIFNHEHFLRQDQRRGTDFDALRLKKCFRNLGFDIVEHKDLKVEEVHQQLAEVSSADHSDADCFVCCFLTHGDGEKLHAKDNDYEKQMIFELFKGDKCPSLAGKPKIFIIQACRGDKTDFGVNLEYQTDAASPMGRPIKQTRTIPISADFLISYSTAEGYYSYRNTVFGGPFVQRLVPLLQNYGQEVDLMTILTRVNREVGYEASQNRAGKQAPSFVCTLTRKLVFRRKAGQNPIATTMSYVDAPSSSSNLPGDSLIAPTNSEAD